VKSITKRNRYAAEFKSKVALAALREEATIAEIAAKYGIHPNQVSEWKRQAIEGMAATFTGTKERNEAAQEAQLKELHAKIGKLTMERDFLAKAFGK
jgi:transposase